MFFQNKKSRSISETLIKISLSLSHSALLFDLSSPHAIKSSLFILRQGMALVSSTAVSFQKSNKMTSEHLAMPTRKAGKLALLNNWHMSPRHAEQDSVHAEKESERQCTTTQVLRIQQPPRYYCAEQSFLTC